VTFRSDVLLTPGTGSPKRHGRQLDTRYDGFMSRAYDEIVEFIARGSTPDAVAGFEPSQQTKDYVAALIHKEKAEGLTTEEASELSHFMQAEHLMRLAKARARLLCTQ